MANARFASSSGSGWVKKGAANVAETGMADVLLALALGYRRRQCLEMGAISAQ
jgi:hypothetical protein